MNAMFRSAEGKLAVVAVLLDRADENKALKTFWDKLPAMPAKYALCPRHR